MEIILLILGVLILIALIWNVYDRDGAVFSGIIMICLTFLFVVSLDGFCSRDIPNAIDVYNNKTTLEITYRDSIAIDTVVVYKPEFRKK